MVHVELMDMVERCLKCLSIDDIHCVISDFVLVM